MAKRPTKDAPPFRPRPPNPDDAFCDELRESCARAMAAHLKEAVNTMRPINSLKLPEMMALAEACTARWIVEVSKRRADPHVRVWNELLLGA